MKLYDIIVKEKEVTQKKDFSNPVITSSTTDSSVLISDVIPPSSSRRKKIALFFAFIFLIVILYVVGFWIQYAKITLYERSIPFTLENVTFDLVHEESTAFTSPYTFQTITVDTEIKRELIGTEFKEVTEYAKGTIIFTNDWSKTSETIPSGTVIESANGKKYKTIASVLVPGYTTNGTTKIQGVSRPVSIVAQEAGVSSNNPGSTFIVPSFSAKKRSLLLAKSVGPLTGGDSGVRHSLSTEEENPIIETLRTQLIERLKRETRAQIPEEFFASPDLQFTYIDSDTFILEGDSIKFDAIAQGRIVSYLIKRDVLYNIVAEEVLKEKINGQFYISDMSNITFKIISSIPIDPSIVPDQIKIQIDGEGILIAKIDENEIYNNISGRTVKEFREYISSHRAVEKAELFLFPFWSPNLPLSKQFLKIEVQ